MAFDGKLSPTSADAAIYELFLQESTRQIFLDELGPQGSPAWKAFIANGNLSYAAQADHLLGREDSPFWDDVRTAQKEDKPAILARSLAAAISAGDSQLGGDHKAWQWGKLHRYEWKNTSGQTVRGPHASRRRPHHPQHGRVSPWGQDFNTTRAPAMRFIVDFGQPEPLMGADRHRPVRQPGQPELPQRYRAMAEGAVPELADAAAEL